MALSRPTGTELSRCVLGPPRPAPPSEALLMSSVSRREALTKHARNRDHVSCAGSAGHRTKRQDNDVEET